VILPLERRRALTAKSQAYAGNADQAMPYLASRGLTKEVAAMFSLGYVSEGEYAGRVSIPYVTPGGVVAIKYRCADISHGEHKDKDLKCPKYLSESGVGIHLFNAQVLIRCADTIVVTEGEMDAICVQAYTGLPAVAYPGVDTFHKQRYFRLCFEGVGEVIVVADGDEPGRMAAHKVAESIGMNARVVDLPNGEDSSSFIASQGAGRFLERVAS